MATGASHAILGLMVTVVATGAEATPAAFVVVTLTVTSVAVITPDGAVNVTFAELAPVEVIVRFIKATGPV